MECTEKKVLFHGVEDGATFMVGGIEFIKFPDVNGMTPAVARDIVFRSQFGSSNNFAESTVLQRMNDEVLPAIIEEVGAENLCIIKTDLTTWDGLKTYGEMKSLISLPTMDFYRENVEIFDRYTVKSWWWLATADSAQPHDKSPWLVLCVAPSGYIFSGDYDIVSFGVRPFCIFKSSIFGSCEE